MPKKLVEYIVKTLVEKPESVAITQQVQDSKKILEIHVDDDDRGKVIGRSGKTIRSIRVIAGLIFPEDTLLIDIANK